MEIPISTSTFSSLKNIAYDTNINGVSGVSRVKLIAYYYSLKYMHNAPIILNYNPHKISKYISLSVNTVRKYTALLCRNKLAEKRGNHIVLTKEENLINILPDFYNKSKKLYIPRPDNIYDFILNFYIKGIELNVEQQEYIKTFRSIDKGNRLSKPRIEKKDWYKYKKLYQSKYNAANEERFAFNDEVLISTRRIAKLFSVSDFQGWRILKMLEKNFMLFYTQVKEVVDYKEALMLKWNGFYVFQQWEEERRQNGSWEKEFVWHKGLKIYFRRVYKDSNIKRKLLTITPGENNKV